MDVQKTMEEICLKHDNGSDLQFAAAFFQSAPGMTRSTAAHSSKTLCY